MTYEMSVLNILCWVNIKSYKNFYYVKLTYKADSNLVKYDNTAKSAFFILPIETLENFGRPPLAKPFTLTSMCWLIAGNRGHRGLSNQSWVRTRWSRGAHIICFVSTLNQQRQTQSLAVHVSSAPQNIRCYIREGTALTRSTAHVLRFASGFSDAPPWWTRQMPLTLATLGEAAWRAHAQPIHGWRTRRLFDKRCLAASLTTVTLLYAIFTTGERALQAGVALSHAGFCAVRRHVGACRTFVANQLLPSGGVNVVIVSLRQELLCGRAGGQRVG